MRGGEQVLFLVLKYTSSDNVRISLGLGVGWESVVLCLSPFFCGAVFLEQRLGFASSFRSIWPLLGESQYISQLFDVPSKCQTVSLNLESH